MRPPRPRPRRPSAPLAIALLALFIALGGPAQAARVINGKSIKRGTITSAQLKDRSIKPRDLTASALRVLTDTANGSITAAKLGEGSVTTSALAPGSVMTGSVADNNLTAADLASNSVGADEVADNAVGQGEIRNNGVGTTEIADNTINGGKIIDGGLAMSDLARHVGTFEWRLAQIPVNQCLAATLPLPGVDLDGAVVIAAPASGWPSGLAYTVGANAAHELLVQACNRGVPPSPAATTVFNYAVLAF